MLVPFIKPGLIEMACAANRYTTKTVHTNSALRGFSGPQLFLAAGKIGKFRALAI
jgi:hypothetical protein